jgi:S1-C subfamily serine protease
MILVNDQHPFDVAPDDDQRPAAEDAQQTFPEPAATQAPDIDATTAASAEADEAEAFRRRRKHHRVAALSVAAAVIFTAGAGGGSIASLALARSTTATSASGGTSQTQNGQMQNGTGGSTGSGSQGGFGGQFGSGSQGGLGSQGGFGSSGGGTGTGSGSSSATGSTAASSDQIVGLVTIVSQLGYEDGESAGTGIVLTSNGRILTNNHVIDGATAIRVTVQSTGKSYTADVVGTNAKKDVAVLQLENASGLATADLATKTASVGDAVTAVGNANGTGTLSAAAGTVSALDQTITTSSEGATAGETLHGLIEIDADVVSGDSGGAVENSDGDVIGVTTAASSGTSDVTGYAIPIDTAMSIAKQIVAGDDTSEITIGLPAFLGVSLTSDSTSATVASVLPGTAAAKTDLEAGATITKVDGTTISSASALSAAIQQHAVGDRITIGWTDTAGSSHTATVALLAGPAD